MIEFVVGDRVMLHMNYIDRENSIGTVVTGLEYSYVEVKLDNPPREWRHLDTCLFQPEELELISDRYMYVIQMPTDSTDDDLELVAIASTEELAIKYAFEATMKFYNYTTNDCTLSKWRLSDILWVGVISNATGSIMLHEYAITCVPFIG